MSDAPQTQPDKPITPEHAWQPFTPRGIAAFALASNTRLIVVQLAMALLVAATCAWFVISQWFPVIEESLRSFPPATSIVRGELVVPRATPLRLGANSSLEILLDLNDTDALGGTADIVASLTETKLQLCGVLGCFDYPYSRKAVISLARDETEPWWGAWRTPILASLIAAIVVPLFLLWWFAGTLGAPIVKVIAFYADRNVTFGGSWRVANAAQLPGALLVVIGILLHGIRAIDVAQLALIIALHVFCGAVFLFTSPSFLPHIPGKTAGNPFKTGVSDQKTAPNPFQK